MTNRQSLGVSTLPIILVAAIIQGWMLFGLHTAIDGKQWPATSPGMLLACYTFAVFVPLTAQLLAEHARQQTAWIIIALIGALFGYFGWHHGSAVMNFDPAHFTSTDEWVPLAFLLTVLWLLMLPFIQARLVDGQWRPRYEALFATAWRNKLTLAEAVLFTGLFWLLLVLWAQLFKMLGVQFFSELFQRPIFIYPVTSLSFGIALHLIGSVERLTAVILEQVLNVLKWLAIVAGLLLTLFTLALVLKLPAMVASGERAIGAAWLLWLVAVTVLLVNAAYRDGAIEQPYPRVVALALRCAVPLTVVIAFTAVYAMYLRLDAFGFTAPRVWGLIVAAMACFYSVGYAFAARRSDRWMASIANVNIAAALLLIVILALTLTPLLSPYRIAANSQFRLAQTATALDPKQRGHEESPLDYLRFSAGRYGLERLDELTKLQNHPRAEEIRKRAAALKARKDRWMPETIEDAEVRLANMRLPADRTLEPRLRQVIAAELHNSGVMRNTEDTPTGGAFIDLDRDGQEEFIFVYGRWITAYALREDDWLRVGTLKTSDGPTDVDRLLQGLLNGNVQLKEPRWHDVQIGATLLQMTSQ